MPSIHAIQRPKTMADHDSSPCKRHCAEFDRLKAWIEKLGGLVHPAVTMADRELRVLEESAIPADTDVLRIPSAALVTRATLPDEAISINNPTKTDSADLQIALYLASRPNRLRPYLDSLPTTANLPREWSESTIQELLGGSPLMNRVLKARKDLQDDYKELSKHRSSLLPSLAEVSWALSMVSSRAFSATIGCESFGAKLEEPMLVPLLDLCNHRRGHAKKNLRYSISNGSVVVQAMTNLAPGTPLHITYGAQGNGPLLFNYGFCIENNLEPDGSSNDILEFHLGPNKVVELRTGPKSYTYGGLVKALEHFYPLEDGDDESASEHADAIDDMEAFLKECEDAEEEDDGDENDQGVDIYSSKPVVEKPMSSVSVDLVALKELASCLAAQRDNYALAGDKLSDALKQPPSPLLFAAMWIAAEQRVIYFFLEVVRRLERILNRTLHSSEEAQSQSPPTSPPADLTENDKALIDEQVNELVDAFVEIRHQLLA